MNNLTPSEFYLCQNYPNPFKERTTIKFCVAYKTKVKLEVFNSEDNIIKILVDEEKEAGTYQFDFDTIGLTEGTYFYQLAAENYKSDKKMILIK
jgi:hypothetical protein